MNEQRTAIKLANALPGAVMSAVLLIWLYLPLIVIAVVIVTLATYSTVAAFCPHLLPPPPPGNPDPPMQPGQLAASTHQRAPHLAGGRMTG